MHSHFHTCTYTYPFICSRLTSSCIHSHLHTLRFMLIFKITHSHLDPSTYLCAHPNPYPCSLTHIHTLSSNRRFTLTTAHTQTHLDTPTHSDQHIFAPAHTHTFTHSYTHIHIIRVYIHRLEVPSTRNPTCSHSHTNAAPRHSHANPYTQSHTIHSHTFSHPCRLTNSRTLGTHVHNHP